MLKLLIWWLTQEDYHGFEPCQESNPLCIPDYAWVEFRSRYGRSGGGRLWVPDHLDRTNWGIDPDDPRWTPKLMESGGIVIEPKDAEACLKWGGTITTLTLDPIETQLTETKEGATCW